MLPFPEGSQNVRAILSPVIEQAMIDSPEIFARSSHDATLHRALVLLQAMTPFTTSVHVHQGILSKAVLMGISHLEVNSPNYVISCASQDSKADCSITQRWCQNLIIIKFLGLARSVLGGAGWRWGWPLPPLVDLSVPVAPSLAGGRVFFVLVLGLRLLWTTQFLFCMFVSSVISLCYIVALSTAVMCCTKRFMSVWGRARVPKMPAGNLHGLKC